METTSLLKKVSALIKKYNIWIVFLLLIAICWGYNYPEILLKRPQSVHAWRQCDGASLALNYYQNGMHFFKPQVHALYNDGWTSGYSSPSEMPILYYGIAGLYKIFGYHEYIFRLTVLSIFILGLLYLFRLGSKVIGDKFWAFVAVILLFSSPIIVFYANNFLPNPVSFSFSIIGWYYFYCYYKSQETGLFALSTASFLIAGLMKITELSGPIIILALLLLDRIKHRKLKLGTEKHFVLKILLVLLIFISVAGWIIYAKHYNNIHSSSYFSTQTYPLWHLNQDEVRVGLKTIRQLWFPDYFMPLTLYLTGFMAIFSLVKFKHMDQIIGLASIAYFGGLVLYSLLWFEALIHHDYFLISFYILPAFIYFNFFRWFYGFIQIKKANYYIQSFVIVFLIVNVGYASRANNSRYTSWENDSYIKYKELDNITDYLRSINITKDDIVVFVPDVCIRPLYLMNQPGWVLPVFKRYDPHQPVIDSIDMRRYIKGGARYLITNDLTCFYNRRSLLPYISHLVAQHGNIFIFKLPPEKENMRISDQPKVRFDITCDAENFSGKKSLLYFNDTSYRAFIGGVLTDAFHRSGKFSVLSDRNNSKAFITKILGKPMDIFEVKAYCYGDTINCTISCNIRKGEKYYGATVLQDIDSTGWKAINGTFVLPSYARADTLNVYLWNQGGSRIYFDDFEIKVGRYDLIKTHN
jgi:hypothetical protein